MGNVLSSSARSFAQSISDQGKMANDRDPCPASTQIKLYEVHMAAETLADPLQDSEHNISSGNGDTTTFNRDIKLLDADEKWVYATGLLDTQCQVGNWISRRLVQQLSLSHRISTCFEPPEIIEASGHPVKACGVIDIYWKWHNPKATRTQQCRFFVFSNSDHLDVVFGVDYIMSENLLRVNESVILTLVEHRKATEAEKLAIANAKERQKREKAALEERRKREEEDRKKQQQQQQQQQGGDRT